MKIRIRHTFLSTGNCKDETTTRLSEINKPFGDTVEVLGAQILPSPAFLFHVKEATGLNP